MVHDRIRLAARVLETGSPWPACFPAIGDSR